MLDERVIGMMSTSTTLSPITEIVDTTSEIVAQRRLECAERLNSSSTQEMTGEDFSKIHRNHILISILQQQKKGKREKVSPNKIQIQILDESQFSINYPRQIPDKTRRKIREIFLFFSFIETWQQF
jgi:hypothetical protein